MSHMNVALLFMMQYVHCEILYYFFPSKAQLEIENPQHSVSNDQIRVQRTSGR